MKAKQIGISTSSLGYTMGVTGKGTDRVNLTPWTLEQFVDFGIKEGIGIVEAPLMRFVPDLNADRLLRLKATLDQNDISLIVDADAAMDREQIRALIPVAKQFNSPLIRIKSSNILGLMRAKLGHPWHEHVESCIRTLTELAPELREHGLRIALENHQDLDSSDLLRIVESVGPDVVGVNFDIGNAFASCEDPLTFARKLGAFIINIHIKDYTIFRSENGFCLVRCAVGSGAVDFKTLVPFLATVSPQAKMVIELGAQEARNIGWLESSFWEYVEPRGSDELIPFFQLLEVKSVRTQTDDWKTLWERGAPGDSIGTTEIEELKASINYLKTV